MSKTAMKLALEALENAQANFGEWWPEAITALREALAEQKSGIKQVIELYDSPDQPAQQEPVAWRYRGILHDFDPSDWAEGPVTPLYTTPPAPVVPDVMTKDEALDLALEALELNNSEWKSLADSGDAGFWSAEEQEHYKQTEAAITAIKQVRALDKKAENARELGLDYEPAEVLGHNGWGFPIKAAAPVQEDWGPGPHECHSLTAASVQEPVAWPCLIAEADFSENTVTLVMQCTDYKVSAGKHWLSSTPPPQRTWVGLTDEEISKIPAWIYSPDQDGMTAEEGLEVFARAIEAKLKEKNT